MTKYIVYIHGLGGQGEWTESELKKHWSNGLSFSTWRRIEETDNVLVAWWAGLERQQLQGIQEFVYKTFDETRDLIKSFVDEAVSGPLTPIINKLFPTLELYFTDNDFRKSVRETLRTVLANAERDDRICMVSHSMGTVIAYDVLSESETGASNVDLLITMGSPLGLPKIISALHSLHGKIETPRGLRRWLNVYDSSDPITRPEPKLARIYRASTGAHMIRDVEVRPNYSDSGVRDPHAWFGYLSSDPVGRAVSEFLFVP